jgi:FkbM family methyltransferase
MTRESAAQTARSRKETTRPSAAPPTLSELLLVRYGRSFPIDKGKLRVLEKIWPMLPPSGSWWRTGRLRYGGYAIECDLRELIQRQIYFFGDYLHERPLLELWCRYARSSRTIFDVGSNVGVYSLAASWANPSSQIHAFEPTPEVASALEETIRRNGITSIRMNRAAVSNRSGLARLVRCRGETGWNGGRNSVSGDIEAGCEVVATVTIAEYCRQHAITQIDLLKVDVEGHEFQVLDGARDLISARRVKRILMELNWTADRGKAGCAEPCLRLLEDAGYVFGDPRKAVRFRPLGDWIRGTSDVVAVLAERGPA